MPDTGVGSPVYIISNYRKLCSVVGMEKFGIVFCLSLLLRKYKPLFRSFLKSV